MIIQYDLKCIFELLFTTFYQRIKKKNLPPQKKGSLEFSEVLKQRNASSDRQLVYTETRGERQEKRPVHLGGLEKTMVFCVPFSVINAKGSPGPAMPDPTP